MGKYTNLVLMQRAVGILPGGLGVGPCRQECEQVGGVSQAVELLRRGGSRHGSYSDRMREACHGVAGLVAEDRCNQSLNGPNRRPHVSVLQTKNMTSDRHLALVLAVRVHAISVGLATEDCDAGERLGTLLLSGLQLAVERLKDIPHPCQGQARGTGNLGLDTRFCSTRGSTALAIV